MKTTKRKVETDEERLARLEKECEEIRARLGKKTWAQVWETMPAEHRAALRELGLDPEEDFSNRIIRRTFNV